MTNYRHHVGQRGITNQIYNALATLQRGTKRKNGFQDQNANRKKAKTAPKKPRRGARTNINVMAGKASIKVKGRKKIRSIVHRKKAVKVSRPLRKKIQKVIDGELAKGTYTTTRFGTIGITNSNEATISTIIEIDKDMGGYPDSFAFQKQQKNSPGYNRWWFAQPIQKVGVTTAFGLIQGSEWQFFTPLKVIDAASVLWNRKAITVDYAIQTDNFNTVVVAATGAPVAGGTASDPGIKGFKVLIDNSYVKFTMKNNSQRTLKISVYNCVPKIKFPNQLPLDSLQDGIIEETDGANTSYFGAHTTGFTSLQQAQALLVNPQFEPSMCKSFAASWKYEKKVIRIDPGETITHSIQGPKGYLLDYRKLWDGGLDQGGLAYKQTSCCVMMSFEVDMVYSTAGVGSDTQGITGHYAQTQDAINSLVEPLSIQWDEVYRLSIPDVTGFSKSAIGDTAGDAQVLNLRIPRRAFGNFTNTASDTVNPTYIQYDEENPGLAISNP